MWEACRDLASLCDINREVHLTVITLACKVRQAALRCVTVGVGSGRFLAAPGVSGDVCAMRCRVARVRGVSFRAWLGQVRRRICVPRCLPTEAGKRARRFGEGPATAGVRARVAAPASSEGVRPPRPGGRRSPRCPVPVVPVLSRCSVRGLSATRLRAG